MALTPEQRITDLESQLVEATADNTALLEAMGNGRWGWDDSNCVFCDDDAYSHTADCILRAEHPGSRLLERLEDLDDALSCYKAINEDLKQRLEAADVCVEVLLKIVGLYERRFQGLLNKQIEEHAPGALAAYDKLKEPTP